MTTPSRSIWRTLGSLALALFNATLILLALCLWLAWQVTGTARAVVSEIGSRMASLDPLRGEVAALTSEVTGLRQDLAAIRMGDPADGEVVSGLRDRLSALDARLDQAVGSLEQLAADPGVLVDRAVEAASRSLGHSAARLMECAVPVGG